MKRIDTHKFKSLAASLGLRVGFVDDVRRLQLPYSVEYFNLSREYLGDQGFKDAINERRAWIRDMVHDDHDVDTIRRDGRVTGYVFLFANEDEAEMFRSLFRFRLLD
jgi:hypothetical protein